VNGTSVSKPAPQRGSAIRSTFTRSIDTKYLENQEQVTLLRVKGLRSVRIHVHQCQSVPKNSMTDVFTKAKRSDVMSCIRSRGNKDTELALMQVFRVESISGWRRQVELRVKKRSTSLGPSPRSGEGEDFRVRPDFVFPKLRLAGCLCSWAKIRVRRTFGYRGGNQSNL